MKKAQQPSVYYCGNEFVMVQKAQDGFGPGSVVCVDADEDGQFEYEAIVGKDGIWALSFEFLPQKTTKNGLPVGPISMMTRAADGSQKTEPYTFQAIQESTRNLAKAIPVNYAVGETEDPGSEVGEAEEALICTGGSCATCSSNDTLLGSSAEGFTGSNTPTEYGVETATGKYRSAYFITAFDTRMLGFNLNLHHSTMVKYDGPVGQSFSHSYNMMIVQEDELTGRVVTPDLRIFDIYSEDGIDWHLPEGFYARLCIDHEMNRWILTHYSGLEIAFYRAVIGCPGYPISIREPNGNTACMTYDPCGRLQDITTDLGQVQIFRYDINGRLESYADHINRTWRFPHDAEGRLSGIDTPATTYADIAAGREIIEKDLDDVLVTRERCWRFGYRDDRYPNQITAETDPRGATYRENSFDEKGRVVTVHINKGQVRMAYDGVRLPMNIEPLEAGNRLRSITDRGGNITYQEIHGIQGGPKNKLGKFGLRRSITLTERGKGNAPLRDDEPGYWEQRWLHDCDCLVPIVATRMFSGNNLEGIQFDEFGIPQNMPREIFTFNPFRQKTGWTYTDGTESISNQWTYQRKAFGDNRQFSRMLTETDAREFDDNPIYAGVNFIHSHQYDEFGNHTRHTAPTVTMGTDTPQKIAENWTFNEFGQPLSYVDPNGNVTTYAYFEGPSSGGDINTSGRFGGYLMSMTRGADGSADPAPHLTRQYQVNALGMNTLERDENGFDYGTQYDDLQEVVRQRQPMVTLMNGKRVRYETRHIFDGAGNIVMTRQTNIDVDGTIPSNAWIDRSASFDIVNNMLSERMEIDGNDANDLITRYAYDNNDDQVVVQKPQGNRSFTIFDERHLTFKTFYGVAPARHDSGILGMQGASLEGYPADKRALSLDDVSFVGLSIDTYDARYNRVRRRDGRGNFEDHFFDFYNRQVAYCDPNGNGWVRAFDDASNTLTESRGAVSKKTGQITELLERSYSRFDETGRQYQQVRDIDLSTDESGLVDPDDGNNSSYLTLFDPGSRVILSLDANGNPTSMVYDAADRMITATDALGNQQTNTYDADSNVVGVTEVELPGPGAAGDKETYITTFAYDELNRRIEQHIRGLNGNSLDHAWFFAYDSRNNQRLVQDAEDNYTLATYDDSDRRIMMQRFDGNPLSGMPTELLHNEWGYDKNSNVAEERALSDVNDPKSLQVTRHAFDDLDRNIRTVLPDSDDPIDGSDNGPDGIFDRIEMAYDENSNPVKVTDQREVVFITSFDPGNRPTEQNITLPAEVPGTTRQTFVYDALNRTIAASNNYANIKYRFDAFSRPVNDTQSIRLDGTGLDTGWEDPIQVAYRYDKQSNRIAYKVLDGSNVDLDIATTLDTLNRTSSISAAYFKTPMHPIADYAYLGPGRVQQKTLGNRAKLSCVYDPKRRIRSYQWNGPNRLLAGFEYDYDRMDNVLYERFLHDKGLCDHFQYNDRYEVTGASYRVPGAVPPVTYTNTFDYDDLFNRRQANFGSPFETTATTSDSYAINRANEYARLTRNGNPTTPMYDRAGNATRFLVRPAVNNPNQQDVTAIARWDAYNLLFDIDPGGVNPRQDFRYDPLRRRIVTLELNGAEIREGSRRFIYDGWSVVEERLFGAGVALDAASSSLERIYVNGMQIDEPLLAAIDRNQDGELGGSNDKNVPIENADLEYYFLNNRLKSIMALNDADTADRVIEFYRYSIYGEPIVLTDVDEDGDNLEDTSLYLPDDFDSRPKHSLSRLKNTFMYTARRFDHKIGLFYYRMRYFATNIGRFVGRDSKGYTDGLNQYVYVTNRPLVFVDPLGNLRWRIGVSTEYSRERNVGTTGLGDSPLDVLATDNETWSIPAHIDFCCSKGNVANSSAGSNLAIFSGRSDFRAGKFSKIEALRKNKPYTSIYYNKKSKKYHAPTMISISAKEKKLPQCKNRVGTEVRFLADFRDKVEMANWTVNTPIGSIGNDGTRSVDISGFGFSYTPEQKGVLGTGSQARANLYFVLCCREDDKDYTVHQPHKQTLQATDYFNEIWYAGSKGIKGSSKKNN